MLESLRSDCVHHHSTEELGIHMVAPLGRLVHPRTETTDRVRVEEQSHFRRGRGCLLGKGLLQDTGYHLGIDQGMDWCQVEQIQHFHHQHVEHTAHLHLDCTADIQTFWKFVTNKNSIHKLLSTWNVKKRLLAYVFFLQLGPSSSHIPR